MKSIATFILFSIIATSLGFPDWRTGNRHKWTEKCEFKDHDLYSKSSKRDDCSRICFADASCTHFTWTEYNGGTCFLKKGNDLQPKQSKDDNSICGYVQRNDADSLAQLKKDIKEGRKPIRGVNLGGWLVAEHWMTTGSPAWDGVPDSISDTGEYSTMKFLGHEKGDVQFKSHRNSFVKEQDFRDIAAAGLNTVRIPVGYWITGFDHSGGGDPDGWKVYAPGAINYLDYAIREWAPNNNILVIISMHAAKGSQNGNDNSSPNDPGHAYWSSYQENVNNTLDTVEWLAKRYNKDLSFLGIGLLNEPDKQNKTVLKQYYYDAYGRIRTFSDCLLTTSPLLTEQDSQSGDWNQFMPPPNWEGIRHEWHRYQVWGFEAQNGWDANKVIDYVNNELTNDIKIWTGNWLYIGEWSLASSVSMDDDDTLRRYSQAQLNAFSNAPGGWTYWTWKMYNDDGSSRNQWSMKSMINRGLLQLN